MSRKLDSSRNTFAKVTSSRAGTVSSFEISYTPTKDISERRVPCAGALALPSTSVIGAIVVTDIIVPDQLHWRISTWQF
jgi:hypothetical protein